jgi:hypothetical protein
MDGSAAQHGRSCTPLPSHAPLRMLPCNAIIIQGTTQLTASQISAWRAHKDSHQGTCARQACVRQWRRTASVRASRSASTYRAPVPTFTSPLLSFLARLGGTSVALVTRGQGGEARSVGLGRHSQTALDQQQRLSPCVRRVVVEEPCYGMRIGFGVWGLGFRD